MRLAIDIWSMMYDVGRKEEMVFRSGISKLKPSGLDQPIMESGHRPSTRA